MGSVVISE